LLSKKDFIEASKNFVCVRPETYENLDTQDRIRSLLHGTMQNTAFAIYKPDGKATLTAAGRSPQMALRVRDNASVIERLDEIAAKFKPFKQSLNVASADQRLLVFTSTTQSDADTVKINLRTVFNDSQVCGRFHFDTRGSLDKSWADKITGESATSGIFVIQSGEFGQTGKVVAQLPVTASAEQIKTALLSANKTFAESEKRKNYNDHVKKGRKEGINFENNIQHGEDRDGDGKIDPKGRKNSSH